MKIRTKQSYDSIDFLSYDLKWYQKIYLFFIFKIYNNKVKKYFINDSRNNKTIRGKRSKMFDYYNENTGEFEHHEFKN